MVEKWQSGLSLVIGGAASGKSNYAEGQIALLNKPRVYIATAQAFDTEMADKIAAHQVARGPDWHTCEAPHDLVAALDAVEAGACVLIDCLTLWLSNRLLADADLDADRDALLAALRRARVPVIAVTNETGLGIVPDNALARRFRNAQGRLNQAVAAMADRVVLVTAGLPMVLK